MGFIIAAQEVNFRDFCQTFALSYSANFVKIGVAVTHRDHLSDGCIANIRAGHHFLLHDGSERTS